MSLLLGSLCFVSFLALIWWLHFQNSRARTDGFSEGRTSTLIFPLYTKVLWLGALATLADALSNLLTPTGIPPNGRRSYSMLFYGAVWGLYHFVFEGVALLMLHDGVGSVAAKKSALFAGLWAVFTWFVQLAVMELDAGTTLGFALNVTWSGLLILFYGALWLLPISVLFRRPCVFSYARFWYITMHMRHR